MKRYPLLLPLTGLAAGIVFADLFAIRFTLWETVALFCCLLLSLGLRNRLTTTICSFLFFLAWGVFALPHWTSPPAVSPTVRGYANQKTSHIIEGIIRSRPVVNRTPEGVASSFILEAVRLVDAGGALLCSGNIMVYVRSGEVVQGRGDLVRLATRITTPHLMGLPGEFDFGRYLSHQGVIAIGSVAAPDDIVLMRSGISDRFLARIDGEAGRMVEFIRANVPDEAVSSVMTALLIGDQKRIPQALSDAYTRAGVNHILSISGFHVGIVAICMAYVLLLLVSRCEWLALRFNLRRSVLLATIPVMVLYLLLTGTALATARSVIMLAVFIAAQYAERRSDPINCLLIAALLLLALDPPALFDLSFQLSFLALWGMVLMVPVIMKCFAGLERGWLRMLALFVVTSCVATVVTAIPLLFYFNRVSFNGVLANFLIVPLLGYGAVISGFCALLLFMLHIPGSESLLWLCSQFTRVSNWLVEYFSRFPGLRYYGITSLDLVLFLAIMMLATFTRKSRITLSLCALLAAFAMGGHLVQPSMADGKLRISMLSVGQAESLLFRLPDGSVMLVDGGGYLFDTGRDFGERVLAPALLRMGIRRIDYMVMTHCHPDHMGGLPYLASVLPVGEFWETAPGGNGPNYDRLRRILADQGSRRRLVRAGDAVALPGAVFIRILSPVYRPSKRDGDSMDLNEQSLVMRIAHGAISCLCMADAGFEAEERMARAGALERSTILKVGHHGSQYSTSEQLLDVVKPQVALISAGYGNNFGLPALRTLDMLRRWKIDTYRTDRNGTIELVSDGATLKVTTPYTLNPEALR